MELDLKKINSLLNKIESSNKICLFVHENPDCDTIGSAFAFKLFIENNFSNKDVRIAGLSNIDKDYLMPFFDREYLPVDRDFAQESIGIIFDTSTQSRILSQLNIFCNWTCLIDHHLSTEEITNLSIVDSSSSSTCEIVASIFLNLSKKYKIDTEIANALYFGILTDTNRFLYPSVSANTFKIMEWLCNNGVSREEVHNQLYLIDIEEVELNHKLFSMVNFNIENHYATLFIDQKYNKKFNQKSFNGKVNLMANIKNIDIWTLVYYDENLQKWKGSIRSREYNVNEIAAKFGGGGHRLASGFTLKDFKETKILEMEIKEFLENVKK